MRKLSVALALALLVSTLFGVSVAAAKPAPAIPSPIAGTELFPGVSCGETPGGTPLTCGATFAGAGSGTYDGKSLRWAFSVSTDYAGTAVVQDDVIVGGKWWLSVYELVNGGYRHYGSVYGKVSSGFVDWPSYRTTYPPQIGAALAGNMAVIAAKLDVSYAYGAYAGSGPLYFAGILDHNAWDARTGLPTVTGYMTLSPLISPAP